jgi:type IV pilus assembly protein PilP
MALSPIERHFRCARSLSWAIATLAGLSGCGQSDLSDLKTYIADVKSRTKIEVDPLPEVRTVEPFVFSGEDLRDPFVPDEKMQEPEEERVETGIRPDTARPKEELESYDLETLQMVGTVVQQGALWGLIKAVDGTIHRVRVGNYLGKNYGKIVSIKENMIELVEIVADGPGIWRERKAGLNLSEANMSGASAAGGAGR